MRFDFLCEHAPGDAREGSVPEVESKRLVLMTDEIEHGEAWFVVGETEATSELLQKDRGALRRSEEQHGVDLGDVDSFIE